MEVPLLTFFLTLLGALVIFPLVREVFYLWSPTAPPHGHGHGHSDHNNELPDHIYKFSGQMDPYSPSSKISLPIFFPGPTLRILYCSTTNSGSYKQIFEQYKEFINEKYPGIRMIGEIYGGGGHGQSHSHSQSAKKFIAIFLGVLKFGLIALLVLTNQNQWTTISRFIYIPIRVPPEIISWISENRFYSAILLYFVINLVESQLVGTGAFEIYWDDIPVWSKLQCGRIPNPPELIQIIENQLKLGGREKLVGIEYKK